MKEISSSLHINILPKPKIQTHTFYMLLLVFGFTIHSISIFHMKLLGKWYKNFNPNHFLVYRCLALSTLSALCLKLTNKEIQSLGQIKSPLWLILRGIINFVSSATFLLSLNYLRLSTAVIFTCLSPVFTCILTVILLGEKFYFRYLLGIIICLFGSTILMFNEKNSQDGLNSSPIDYESNLLNTININSSFLNDTFFLSENNTTHHKSNNQNVVTDSFFGFFLGLIYCISFGLQNTINKLLLNQKIENNLLLFYLGIIIGNSALVTTLLFSDNLNNLKEKSFFFNAILNGSIFYIASYINNSAYYKLDLMKTTGISYVMTVESFFFGVLFLGEDIYFTDIIGTSLIISYNFYNTYYPIK